MKSHCWRGGLRRAVENEKSDRVKPGHEYEDPQNRKANTKNYKGDHDKCGKKSR